MNNCILMAKIISNPELRYTQDNQTPVTDMWVEFEGLQPNEAPSTLRVVGWGNLASDIQQKYSEGDVVIIEGRLSMNTIDRPDGLKEKRAELVASRIHNVSITSDRSATSSPSVASEHTDYAAHTPQGDRFAPMNSSKSMAQAEAEYDYPEPAVVAPPPKQKKTETKKVPTTTLPEPAEQDLDDIPF